MLTIAGITVLPVSWTFVAPPGALTVPVAPIAVIWPFWTTNSPFSIGGVVSPMINRAP